MPSTPTSNCAIPRGWSLGEDGWDVGDDLGRQIIDCLLTGTVKNIVTTLPSSGQVLGDTYIMAADAGTHARKLAMWVEDRAAAGYCRYSQHRARGAVHWLHRHSVRYPHDRRHPVH